MSWTNPTPTAPPPGLCGTCRHGRAVPSSRGAVFMLCQRSMTDPRFPRYPPLPVVRCVGYEAREPGDAPPTTDRR